jgi:iron complex outermembrane receptor protein/hemoglobin/transferrin/lactoferrin receptor protein
VRILQNGVGQEFYQYGVRHHPPTSLAEAERVEVVRGAASILYGSDALGGAVNVLTRRLPWSPEGRLHVGGEVQTQLFSNNGEVAGLLDVHAATSGFGIRAGFETRHGGDIRTPDEPDFFQTTAAGTAHTGKYGDPKYTGELPYTDFDQWSTYGQVGMRGPLGVVEAFVTHWDDENNYLLPSGGPKGSEGNPPLGVGLHLAQTNVVLKGSLVGNSVVIRPTVSWQRALRQALPSGVIIGDDADWEVDLRKDILTARLEVVHTGGGPLDGTVGAELVHHDGRTRGRMDLEPGATVTGLGVYAFEEAEHGRLTMAVGARIDHRRQDAEANLLTEDPDLLESSYTVLSGSLGAVYRLGAAWAVAANATSGFRAPTVFELFANGEHGGVAAFQRGDPELEPERSLGMDFAVRVHSGRLRGEVNVYQTFIRDYIYLENTGAETGQGLPIYQAGQTNASIRGVDGTAELDVTGWLAMGGHFSALRGTGDDIQPTGGGRGGPLPLLPPTEMGGFVQLHGAKLGPVLAPALRIDVHHTRAKDAAGAIEPFSQFDLTPFGTASTEAYTLVDTEARIVAETGLAPMSVALTVTNLFDTPHRAFLDTYKGYALSMGRNVGLRASMPVSFRR